MSVLDPTVPHVHAPRRALATGILIFAAFMDLVDVTIVNVALPVHPGRPARDARAPRVGAQRLHPDASPSC